MCSKGPAAFQATVAPRLHITGEARLPEAAAVMGSSGRFLGVSSEGSVTDMEQIVQCHSFFHRTDRYRPELYVV